MIRERRKDIRAPGRGRGRGKEGRKGGDEGGGRRKTCRE